MTKPKDARTDHPLAVPADRRKTAFNLVSQSLGFKDCPAETIDTLVRSGSFTTLGKGEAVVRYGQPSDKLFFIVEGCMEASITQANGRRFLLAYLQPGDIGGLISLLDHLPRLSDMLARTQGTVILTIQGAALRALGEKHPCITQALLVQIAYRARLLHERLVMDSSMTLEVRLARILCLLLRISARLPPAEASATLHMSQADLGDLLGVGRTRVNHAVQQLKRQGMIESDYSEVRVIDHEKLSRMAGV